MEGVTFVTLHLSIVLTIVTSRFDFGHAGPLWLPVLFVLPFQTVSRANASNY
jgi:hypothetical protein